MAEDKEIIHLLKTDSSEGLRQAIAKYRGGVYAVCLRVLAGRAMDAEECVADTFTRVWKAAQKGQVDENTDTFKGFIYSTARNTAITRYKKLAREQTLPLEDAEYIMADENVAELVVKKETSARLQKAILDMQEPDRQIFFRRYFLFESVKEIARQTGCTETQVKNRLYRAKPDLQASLKERGICLEDI